jgi:hypothetical protein
MSNKRPTLFVAITFSLVLGLARSGIDEAILLSAVIGALLAPPVILWLTFGKLAFNLGVMHSLLSGNSNIPAIIAYCLLAGAAMYGWIFAGIGHFLGTIILWGHEMSQMQNNQIIIVGIVGLLGNIGVKTLRKKAKR